MLQKLIDLQEEIYRFETTDFDTGEPREYWLGEAPRISFSKLGDLYELNFFGEGFDEEPETKATDLEYDINVAFCRFLDFIIEPQHAEKIISLNFSGADRGANGTKSWDFARIINSEVVFPNLKSFSVQLTDLGDHNSSVIDYDFSLEESGVIAKLLRKMPHLESLTVPSAPDKSFFEIGKHPLYSLKVQAGYGHQNFIENLSESTNFEQLVELDYSEEINFFGDFAPENYTPFEHFKKLFQSKAFASVGRFILRNSVLTKEQLFELQQLNDVQFLYIDCKGGQYVRHLMEKNK